MSDDRPARVWTRYVAIGDSFTEGLVDEDPDAPGAFVGWADRLAGHLDAVAAAAGEQLAYANLAIRGRLLADVVGPQLDAALAQGPDLISIVGGGNDILRPSVDLTEVADRLEAAVVRARAAGADVLLATPTDPRDAGLLSALRTRQAVHTANVLTIAGRHGAYVLNQWGMAWLRDWRMWGVDRIHPSPEAHRRLALEAMAALGLPVPAAEGDTWRDPLPPREPEERWTAISGHAHWLVEYAGPWVRRRIRGESSGDTVTAKRPVLRPLTER